MKMVKRPKLDGSDILNNLAASAIWTVGWGGVLALAYWLWKKFAPETWPTGGDVAAFAVFLAAGMVIVHVLRAQARIEGAGNAESSPTTGPSVATAAVQGQTASDPPPPPAEPSQLIVFARASFIPAWQACIQVIIDIRTEVRINEGARIEEMFQLLLDKGNPIWTTLDAKVRAERQDKTLDSCLADAYVQYELMARWIETGGEPHGFPKPDDEHLQDWLRLDAKMLDALENLVASTAMEKSELATARQSVQAHRPAELRKRLAQPRRLPPMPDEREVILLRGYGLPAYDAAYDLLMAATDECFKVGGWQGLAGRLVRDYGGTVSYKKVAEFCEGAIESGSKEEFLAAFQEFADQYHNVMRFVYHFGSRGDISLDAQRYVGWAKADAKLMREWEDLTKGLRHDELKELLGRYRFAAAEIRGYMSDFRASLLPADTGVTPSE